VPPLMRGPRAAGRAGMVEAVWPVAF
jgi:hypothetical protein